MISAVDFHTKEPILSMAWPIDSSDSWRTEAPASSEVGKSMTARDATSWITDVFSSTRTRILYIASVGLDHWLRFRCNHFDQFVETPNHSGVRVQIRVWIWVRVWFGSVIVLGLVWVFGEDGFEEIHYSLLFVPISYWCWVCVYCFCVWLTRKISCWVCVCCFCVRLTRKIYCWVCVCVSGFLIFGF